MVQKTGRNESCPCGSGLKHKFCCGGNGGLVPEKQAEQKVLTQKGLIKCLQLLVKNAKGMNIPCSILDAVPKDEVLGFKYDPETDSFNFVVAKIKTSPIIQPDKRIRRPIVGGN